MKKSIALTLALSMVAASLAGCGSSAAKQPAASSSTTAATSEQSAASTATGEKDFSGITLNFAQDLGTGEVDNATMQKLLDEYQAATGVTIQFNNVTDDWTTWLATQFAAGQGPDVYSGILYDMTTDFNAGYLYNFNDLYEKESAYDPGQAWKDTLPDYILQRMYVADGAVPGYPTTSQVVRIFYNKNLLDQADCAIPTTWTEFMEVCQKLSDSGVTPFGFPNASISDLSWLWFNNSISNQLNHDQLEAIDVSGNGYVELNELVKAYEEGNFTFTEDQLKAGYELMKDFSQYWTSDYNGLDQETAFNMFIRGEVAMVQGMSTKMTSLTDGIANAFEIGVMPVPTITSDTSSFAMGQSVVLGGQPDIIYGINSACESDEKKLAAAIDFVQFLSSPETQMTFCNAINRLPLATSTTLPENLQGFRIIEDALRVPYYTGVSNEWRDYFQRGGQMYLSGDMSIDEYCDYLNESFATVCDQLMADNGWSADNNYGLNG